MMRAGVLSRGIVDEIVTQEAEKYSSTSSKVKKEDEQLDKLNIPIGLGASDAQIRKQMPAGWNPGDPVDLPLDALLHYMGRSFFTVCWATTCRWRSSLQWTNAWRWFVAHLSVAL